MSKQSRKRRFYIIIFMVVSLVAIVLYGVERVAPMGIKYFENYLDLVHYIIMAFSVGISAWVTGQVFDMSSIGAVHRKKNKVSEEDF